MIRRRPIFKNFKAFSDVDRRLDIIFLRISTIF